MEISLESSIKTYNIPSCSKNEMHKDELVNLICLNPKC